MMAKRKGFMMYFEWVDMMRELDGETFKRLSLSSMRDRDYIRFVSASNALHFALKNL